MSTMAAFDIVEDDRPLRVIVAGAGHMGTVWLRAVTAHPDLELAGVVDPRRERAREVTRRLGVPDVPVAADLDALPGRADFCVIATPAEHHYGIALKALRSGFAVLCEKPFTETLAQAAHLTETARQARALLMVSQSARYQPALETIKKCMSELGPIIMVENRCCRAGAGPGGPGLLDTAAQAFDTVRFLTSDQPLTAYYSSFGDRGGCSREHTCATGVFEMRQGARFVYTGSSDGTALGTSAAGDWRITGARGVVEWGGMADFRMAAKGAEPLLISCVEEDRYQADQVHQVTAPLEEFMQAVRTGSRPWGECGDNLHTMTMVHGAIASSLRGAPVNLDDLLAKEVRALA
jgi:predicted dehydrogenase